MPDYEDSLIEKIRSNVSDILDPAVNYSDDMIMRIIEDAVFAYSFPAVITNGEVREISHKVFNSFRGMDVLQPYIDDKEINEIMIVGKDRIFIEKNGRIVKENVSFKDTDRLLELIRSTVSDGGRTVNEAVPIMDSRLPDGSRINVVLPPIALNGPIVTIRKFPENPYTLNRLTELKTITEEAAEFLRMAVKKKNNIFICGGTGTGKTTFLNALSGAISSEERIVTIEDSAELDIRSTENIVRLEKREANIEGKGEISIRELIKTALRMRPDRIIVGEVRGNEALDMLQAMNTGHDGSMSTGHSNSAYDMIYRLETMVLFGMDMPLIAVRQQIASSIDLIIHLGKSNNLQRRVLEISEINGINNGNIKLTPLFVYDSKEDRLTRTDNKQRRTRKTEGLLHEG